MTVLRPLLAAAAAFAPWLSGCGTLKVTGPEGLRHGCVEQAAVWVGGYDAAFDAGTGAQALFPAPYVVIDAGAVAEPEHVVGLRVPSGFGEGIRSCEYGVGHSGRNAM